jgi:putative oxidoreductase
MTTVRKGKHQMKIAALIARYLLGFIFIVFALNGFLPFLPAPPMPAGPATQFITALAESHYMEFIFAVQLAGGILLLVNRYVPLALTILAPVIVNIFFFHALMAPAGLPLALIVLVLWCVVAAHFWSAFAGILQARQI